MEIAEPESKSPSRRGRGAFCRMESFGVVPEAAMFRVMDHIDDPRDRAAVSLVCRHWHRVDSVTRRHVTVAMSYSTTPAILRRRFPCLQSLKIKSKPRASMFGLIPDDWGGYAGPWIGEIVRSYEFLNSLNLRRMIVTDHDIGSLVAARAEIFVSLKLDRCSGFSTDSLSVVARSCRKLEILYLEDSRIVDRGGGWLHELAVNNNVLQVLNFYLTELTFSPMDLALLAKNCRTLASLKITDANLPDLDQFFRHAISLCEFSGGNAFIGSVLDPNDGSNFFLPRLINSLGLSYLETNQLHIIFPYAASLKKLDLQFALLNTDDHCQLIDRCPNLEILEAREVIGDNGLQVVARTCKKLRRLRVERGDDEQGHLEDEQGRVTQVGLTALAQGCPLLTHIAIHVSDITNAALQAFGTHSINLLDFRVVLLDREQTIIDLPLDNGVCALLRGCSNLRMFALYLRSGGLSDVGLGYVGAYGSNIRYMLLGNVGESDFGLSLFAKGAKSLQKLELRSCFFSERALANAIKQLKSLKYVWVHGYNSTATGMDLLEMARPYWNIEFFCPPQEHENAAEGGDDVHAVMNPPQVLAYYSLAGRRTDYPTYVIQLHPS